MAEQITTDTYDRGYADGLAAANSWDGAWRTAGQTEEEARRVLMTWTKAELVERHMAAWQRDNFREHVGVKHLLAQNSALRAALTEGSDR